LGNVFGAVAEKMLQLFGVEFFDHLLFAFDDIRILFMEHLESSLVLEQHFQEASSSLKHLIQTVFEPYFEAANGLIDFLSGFVFVLGIPNIMSDELLNLLLLVVAQVLFSDFVGAEHFHQPSHVFDQDVVTCYHDLLVRWSRTSARRLVISSGALTRAMAFSSFGRRFVCLSVVIHLLLVPARHLTFLWSVGGCGPLLVCLFLFILFVWRNFFFRIIESLLRIAGQRSALRCRSSNTTLTRLLLLQSTVSVMIIALLLWHVDVVFQVLGIRRLWLSLFGVAGLEFISKLFIGKDLIRKQHFVHNTVEHSGSEEP